MRAVFVDGDAVSAEIFHRLLKLDDLPVKIHLDPDVSPQALPEVIGDAEIAIIDHTYFPTDVARKCKATRHVVFLGTGARSYMSPEDLAELGIAVHTIKGYGDTAVAESAFALMWEAARDLAHMDREMRRGNWLRTEGMQLTGKTLGLIGFGGIAAELARLASGVGMRVLAWNRTAKSAPNVMFAGIDELLRESHVVSMHLLLNDETRGFLSPSRIASMRRGSVLINTARGALVDEVAMIEALRSGHLRHAGLDVFAIEPLPNDSPLKQLHNVTLSAHSAFRTPEASENLIAASLEHCRRIASEAKTR